MLKDNQQKILKQTMTSVYHFHFLKSVNIFKKTYMVIISWLYPVFLPSFQISVL